MLPLPVYMIIETHRSDGVPVFYAPSVAAWRQYLEQHHNKQQRVWLMLYKQKMGMPTLSVSEAIEEALCFGWVDSKSNGRDASSYYISFSQRNPKSNWSRINKEKIARLEAAGKLASAGKRMVQLAKETGTWDALNEVEDLIIPPDMLSVFSNYPASARENWEAFPRSVKRGILEWIFNAKRPATRAKRIAETVDKASRNERANQWSK